MKRIISFLLVILLFYISMNAQVAINTDGSGFVLQDTLELTGTFTLGNEYSKIEIDFGYDDSL